MNMKKLNSLFLFVAVFLVHAGLFAQQLPDFTGYPSNLYQINPAYTGTKGTIDARLFYRKQWVGFESAPTTQYAAVNSRLWKGRIGLGATMYKDVTGPTKRFNYGFMAAYHLRFPDVEFCAGFGMNFNKYTLDGTGLTTHWTGDPSVSYSIVDFDKTKNAGAGMLLYNDRFHFGLGAMNFIDNKAEFYVDDTSKYSRVNFKTHYYFTCGYNFNGHPDYVWENNLMVLYVDGLPMTIHYNLRVHYREKFMGGVTWRMKDAVALQAGYILLEKFQVIYSYDIGISHLRKGHNGTHEFMLGYRFDFKKSKNGYHNNGDFIHQRYNLF